MEMPVAEIRRGRSRIHIWFTVICMLILLSPAKTLDFESPIPSIPASSPRFQRHAQVLVDQLRKYTDRDLASLMNMSQALGEKTAAQFSAWKKSPRNKQSRPAIFAYQGDVYAGLEAERFDAEDLEFATQHVRILSGLYGILKPLDLIQPYRLEMATPLETKQGRDLYAFWRELITGELAATLDKQSQRVVVNLASNEYSKSIDFRKLNARVITPSFKEQAGDKLRFLSFFGKQARGMMARYLIEQRAEEATAISKFRKAKYRLNRQASSEDSLVFSRPQEKGTAKR